MIEKINNYNNPKYHVISELSYRQLYPEHIITDKRIFRYLEKTGKSIEDLTQEDLDNIFKKEGE